MDDPPASTDPSAAGALLKGLAWCVLVGSALAAALSWLEWRTTWYVGGLLWVLVVPVGLHASVALVRGKGAPSPGALLLLLPGALAAALTALDLPLAAAGLLYEPPEVRAEALRSVGVDDLPPALVVTGALPLGRVEATSSRGRPCETLTLRPRRALAICEGTLSAWERSPPRWARIRRRRGAWWEARWRPDAVRAAIGASARGVVFEAVEGAEARAGRARLSAAALVVLLWWLAAWRIGVREVGLEDLLRALGRPREAGR